MPRTGQLWKHRKSQGVNSKVWSSWWINLWSIEKSILCLLILLFICIFFGNKNRGLNYLCRLEMSWVPKWTHPADPDMAPQGVGQFRHHQTHRLRVDLILLDDPNWCKFDNIIEPKTNIRLGSSRLENSSWLAWMVSVPRPNGFKLCNLFPIIMKYPLDPWFRIGSIRCGFWLEVVPKIGPLQSSRSMAIAASPFRKSWTFKIPRIQAPHLGISGGFQKWGYPKWMVCNGKSLYTWMIWGYPYFGKPPFLGKRNRGSISRLANFAQSW